MTPSRLRQVREVFEGAMAQQPVARRAFVDKACLDDGELADEVASLLAADAAEESGFTWVDEPLAGDVGRPLLQLTDDLPENGRIGSYRLLRPLGSGGMSTVYLATLAGADFQKHVALKLIRRDLGAVGLRRFRLERQILACLDHPYIAQLHDGGTTASGWPYLVMEHVEGERIDRYAAHHGLDVNERLELVRKVCEAVHYAHQNLVIHRDLKPSNILVTAEGNPKLLDFGIAKLQYPRLLNPGHETTAVSWTPLTPGYACPEQVRGESVTTASDVYSLGVLLYQLLAGRRPYDVEGRSAAEVERLVCDTVPPSPSAVVRLDLSREAPVDAVRRVTGDLDAIVLKALAKEPQRRYSSVPQLSNDLERFAAGHPVAARGNAFGYRLTKFARRNKLAVGFAGLAVVFAVAMTIQAERLGHALDALWNERGKVEAEGARAREVTELLVGLFEEASPGRGAGGLNGPVTAREILDRGALSIPKLDGDPLTRAMLLDTVGRVYQNLGHWDRAENLLEQALRLRQANGAEADVVESLRHVAGLRLSLGDLQVAATLSEQALEQSRRLFTPPHAEIAANLHGLGEVRQTQQRLAESETLFQEALAMQLELFGSEHRSVAMTLGDLGFLFQAMGELDEAESRLRQAIHLWRQLMGPSHPQVAINLASLALVHRARADYAGAEKLLEEVLAMQREHLGDGHPDVAMTLGDLGRTYLDQGDFESAEEALRQAVTLREAGNSDDPMLGTALNDLGLVLHKSGEPGQAVPLFRRSLEIHRGSLGAEHPAIAILLTNLARAKRDLGDPAAAEALLREVLALRHRTLEPGHRDLGYTLYELGRLLNDVGMPARAEPLLRDGLAVMRATTTSGDDAWPATLAGHLGLSLVALERFSEAEPLLIESYSRLEAAGQGFEPRARRVRGALAELYRRTGRPTEAAAYAGL